MIFFLGMPRPPSSTLFPYTTLFRSRRDLSRESWTTVQVRLNPAHDASGRVRIGLNRAYFRACRGPVSGREYGAGRNGAPFIDAQPRFGIYRDWRAETQTIYFDKIMFWNADPSEHPDWRVNLHATARLHPAAIGGCLSFFTLSKGRGLPHLSGSR